MSGSVEQISVDDVSAEGSTNGTGQPTRWRILGLSLSLVSLLVIGWVVHKAFQTGNPFADVRWSYLAGAGAVQCLLVFSLPLLWEGILRSISPQWQPESYDRSLLLQAYGRSWLARYIPGKIWMFSGRMLLARPLGLSTTLLARSMAFEVLFAYATLAVFGVSLTVGWFAGLWAGVLSGVATVIAGATVLRIIHLGAKRTERLADRLPFGGIVRKLVLVVSGHPTDRPLARWIPAAYAIHALVQLSFILLVAEGFSHLSAGEAVVVAGAWGLSSVLGYLAFFAPGGLGVRDGLALGLMAPAISASEAGVVLVAARLIMIAADLVFVGLIEVAYYATQRVQTHAAPPMHSGEL